MDLPPQPDPSAIEVTCEDDPLTLEWPAQYPLGFRMKALLALSLIAALAGVYELVHLVPPSWIRQISEWGLAGLVILLLMILWGHHLDYLAPRFAGHSRLVLRKDALIWVRAKGQPPQIYRRSEVLAVRLSGHRLGIRVEEGAGKKIVRFHAQLSSQDRIWLTQVLTRWYNEIA